MYAQLGSIIFEPLSGFNAFNETDDAVIARYGMISGKPYPQQTASELREINVGMKLHQRFIKVKEARMQLRAYKDNGSILALTWGNGEVEGRFLIQSISTGVEESGPYGDVFCVNMNLILVEVPVENLLAVKQADSYKQAFGLSEFKAPVIVTVPKPKPRPIDKFLEYARKAVMYANMIDSLAYGGRFPYLGSSLGQIIGNASANVVLLQANFAAYGIDYEIPDITGALNLLGGSLSSLGAIDPITQPIDFRAANDVFQNFNRHIFF